MDRSKSQLRNSPVRKFSTSQLTLRRGAFRATEALEPRAYLTGFVLGAPTTSTTASLNISPVFANLYPFVTGSSDADLFVANAAGSSGNGSVSVLTPNGSTGTFTNVDTIPVSGSPLPLAVAAPGTLQTTFNGTSFPDIVAGTTGSNGNPGDIAILLGNGDGTFQPAEEIPALDNNQAIATGIFNSTGTGATLGQEDIIAVSNSASNVNNAAIIFPNGGPGGTPSVNEFNLPFGHVSAVATGDFTGNGIEDFVVVSQTNNEIAVFLGNGDGSFKQNVTYATGPSPTSIAVGDFRNLTVNGLPELDIVTADSTGGEVSFLANNGNGTFAAPVNSPVAGTVAGGGPLKVRLANLVGGSDPGLICLDSSGSTADATALLGNGDGTFYTGTTIPIPNGVKSNAIAAGDLTGSGLTDIVLTSSTQVTTLLNVTGTDLTTPTATVTLNPPAGSTSSMTYDFTVTYADAQQIDASTIGNGNLVVTFPDGVTTQAATLVSMGLGDAASIEATYSITFPADLSSADDGAYQVAMNANSVANGGGVFVPAGNIGSFDLSVSSSVVNTTPPTASVNSTQPDGSPTSNLFDFTVTYSDTNSDINASTISGSNLVVTFPNSSTQNATLVSTNLANGPTVAAVYQISFPTDLTTALNGTVYQVSMNANSVENAASQPVAAGTIGSFTLTVSPSQPAPGPTGVFKVGNPAGKIITTVVAGVTKQGGLAVTVTNANGTGPITGTVTVTLYTSSSSIHDSSAVPIPGAVVVKKINKLKVGKSFVVHFKPFIFPTTTGTEYIVADAALAGTLNSTDGASPAITADAPLVHGMPLSVTTTKPTLIAGTAYTAFFVVKNGGNIPYNGPATVGVQVQPTGGILTSIVSSPVPISVHLKPGQSHKYKVTFVPTNLPGSGSDYALVLTINIPGDAAPTSLASTTLLTI